MSNGCLVAVGMAGVCMTGATAKIGPSHIADWPAAGHETRLCVLVAMQ